MWGSCNTVQRLLQGSQPERSPNHIPQQQQCLGVCRERSRRHLPAEDGDRVWVSCSNRDGGVSAVAHRQVVMDCEKQTSRNTFEIWPVGSSYMRK